MKRFWERATLAADQDGWSVLLDGRPVRIPDGPTLRLASFPLAEAVAAEWQAAGGGKGGETRLSDLPLTRLAGTAQAKISPDPEPVVLAVARYAASDLLCYRADDPEALVRRQDDGWQPWLEWAGQRFGARLRVGRGVMPVAQDHAAVAALAGAVAARPVPELAALGVAVPALGSVVLGLAIAEGALDAEAAFELSVLDERFQAEIWGEDAEAQARLGTIRSEILQAGRFMALSLA